MRKIIITLANLLIITSIFAQTPQKISYQAVIRNSSDALVTNTQVGMQISILQASASGTVVYTETQTPTTNANGLVSIEIGGGTGFSTIDWANDIYFIKTETDPTGGTNYTITGTSQLLSVPYALHAKTAETVSGGISEIDPVFAAWDKNYNDLTNTPTIPTVPENVGAFTNDAGYLIGYTETDPIFINWDKDYADLVNIPATITTAQADAIVTNTAKVGITAQQTSDITLNNAKVGITAAQADAIVANTAKVGITVQQASEITVNTAKIGLSPGTTPGEMQYWDGTEWLTVSPGTTGQVLTFVSGVPTWEGMSYVTNPITGKIWMDRNLGASQVATSSTDADAYGDLYQWGRGKDGHQIRTSGTTSTLSSTDNPSHGNFILAPNTPYDWHSPQNDNLWQGVFGTNNPCPIGYRIPTDAELDAERATWSSQNSVGAFASPLKLPVAGYRNGSNGSLGNVDSGGAYWSSTIDGTTSSSLYFYSADAYMNSNNRARGYSVRCIMD